MDKLQNAKVVGELGEGLLPAIELLALGLNEEALDELGAFRTTDASGMLALRAGLSDGAHFDRGEVPNAPESLRADEHYAMGLRASSMLLNRSQV